MANSASSQGLLRAWLRAPFYRKVRVFLSYASEDRTLAENVAFALRNAGYDVFLDRDGIDASDAFHEAIRQQISIADLFIFLVSPHSVAPKKYTLTEVDFARRKWSKPAGHVLPVMAEPTPINSVPTYLSAVNILGPKGNPEAEIVAAATRLLRPTMLRERRSIAVVLVSMCAVVFIVVWSLIKTSEINDAIRRRNGIVLADSRREFEAFLPKAMSDALLDELRSVITNPPADIDPVLRGQQQARAAIALLRTGYVLDSHGVFDFETDPEPLTQFVILSDDLGVTQNELYASLKQAKSPRARYATILAMGERDKIDRLLPENRKLIQYLGALYEKDHSSAVHSACDWLLTSRWKISLPEVSRVRQKPTLSKSKDQEWFVVKLFTATDSPWFATFIEFEDFYILDREIICANFPDGCWREEPQNAVGRATWINAESFVLELKTVPPYELALPHEDEWETACRVGTETPFACGSSEQALLDYAAFNKKEAIVADAVARSRPNLRGVFDMHGNAGELAGPPAGGKVAVRGGNIQSNASSCSTSACFKIGVEDTVAPTGFRLVIRK